MRFTGLLFIKTKGLRSQKKCGKHWSSERCGHKVLTELR